MKPFRAHLVEQEEDYEYKLCSVENIHDHEVLGHIRMALGKYGLMSMEVAGVQTQVTSASKLQFDKYPFRPVYIVKIVMSGPLSSRNAVQSVALFTRINQEKIRFFGKDDEIVMDGADVEQHGHPVEVGTDQAQAEVGDRRAKTLVSDLMKEIAAKRSSQTIERPIYEGFTASHHEINKMLGIKAPRGFYVMESTTAGFATITGPFRKCPDNYDYVGRTPVAVLKETREVGSLVEYDVEFAPADLQADPPDGGDRVVGEPTSVEVTDQDTGKVYTIVVRATGDNEARAKAVAVIASRKGISADRLMPTAPDSVTN